MPDTSTLSLETTDPLIGVSRDAFVPLVRFGQCVKLSAGVIAAVLVLTGRATTLDFALFAVTYGLTMLGITGGFHRMLAHGGFQARRPLRRALIVLGTMAGQGGPLIWVAVHRQHHQFSDRPGDPHSPHAHDAPPGRLSGLWHAQMGWILKHYPAGLSRYIPDLLADPWLVWMQANTVRWVHLAIALAGLVGWIGSGTWQGALTGMLFGGWARLFMVELSVNMVNSICHTYGRRTHETTDRSVNCWPVALLTFGEGWHNNHHACPASARHGLAWWQLDVTWLFIATCRRLGWVDRVILPERPL